MTSPTLTLFHAPNTRSTGALILLEELRAPYELRVLDIRAGAGREASFLAVNPLGKVPTLTHGDAVVTEQVAISIYLADLFPAAGLAPALGDPARGPYLRWLAIYGSCFEPAVTDVAMKREPSEPGMSPYGRFDTLLAAILRQLEAGPYLLGERFTAADLLWGMGLGWTTMFKLIPEHPAVAAYVKRIMERPAVVKVRARDAELAAAHEAAAAAAKA